MNTSQDRFAALLAVCFLLWTSATVAGDLSASPQRMLRGKHRQHADDPVLVRLRYDNVSPAMVRLSTPQCDFDIRLSCKVHGDRLPDKGTDCYAFAPPMLSTCQQTPLTTTLLYNGGDCSQTDNADLLGIACQDGDNVSPPTVEGEESYILVTDAASKGITYHEAYVAVGSEFVIDSGNGQPMEDGFLIQIYDQDDKTTLLQTVSYSQSLCSSTLELSGRFGASQVVGYTNQLQGDIKMFASYTTTLDVSFALKGLLQAAAMDSLSFFTSFAGLIDATDQVQGQVITPSQPVTVTLPVEVDLFNPTRHTLLAGVSVGGGACTTTEFLSFRTGGAFRG